MPLSIKNEQTERLARELAQVTGESITDAIQHSLAERLARLKRRSVIPLERERLEDILRRVDALPVVDARSPDEILGYDEHGLPSSH
jgi:antitoxin VapB